MAATVPRTVAPLTAAVGTIPAVRTDRRSVGVGGATPVETASHVSFEPTLLYHFISQANHICGYAYYIKSEESDCKHISIYETDLRV